MKVKFLKDARYKKTMYHKGQVVEFENKLAEVFVKDSFAVAIKEEESKIEKQEKKETKK